MIEPFFQTFAARHLDEDRCLPQQVQARGIFDSAATGAHRHRHAAQHKLGVEPVAAFFQITAVGHLRDHVGRAQQVTELDVARVGDDCADLFEAALIAGEVHHLTGDVRPMTKADGRQILVHEVRAARDVVAGELCAVAGRLAVRAQIADVMKQRQQQTQLTALCAQGLRRVAVREFIAGHQPRHSQRDVQRVLLIVIDRVDAVIAGHATGEGQVEIVESVCDGRKGCFRPGGGEQFADRVTHIGSRTHQHCVGNVVFTAARAVHGWP